MKIIWIGHACFSLEGKNKKVLTDPFSSDIGLSMPDGIKADIVTVSHQHYDHNATNLVSGNPQVLDKPGDYQIDDVKIRGVEAFHDQNEGAMRGTNLLFKIALDDINIVHLGDLGHLLTPIQIEALEPIDILLVPIGGTYTIDVDQAITVTKQLNPKIIIPMHYQVPGLNLPNQLDNPESLIQKADMDFEYLDLLDIDKNQLELTEPKIVVLSRD